jgi:hypothetical protein
LKAHKSVLNVSEITLKKQCITKSYFFKLGFSCVTQYLAGRKVRKLKLDAGMKVIKTEMKY